jgi:hypothetical protein
VSRGLQILRVSVVVRFPKALLRKICSRSEPLDTKRPSEAKRSGLPYRLEIGVRGAFKKISALLPQAIRDRRERTLFFRRRRSMSPRPAEPSPFYFPRAVASGPRVHLTQGGHLLHRALARVGHQLSTHSRYSSRRSSRLRTRLCFSSGESWGFGSAASAGGAGGTRCWGRFGCGLGCWRLTVCVYRSVACIVSC